MGTELLAQSLAERGQGGLGLAVADGPDRDFDDKADLLRALAAQTLTELAARIRSAAEGHARHSRLHRGCAAYLAHALEQPHHYQLIFGDTPIDQPDQELESAADDAMLAIRELVKRGQTEGELGTGRPRELATVPWWRARPDRRGI